MAHDFRHRAHDARHARQPRDADDAQHAEEGWVDDVNVGVLQTSGIFHKFNIQKKWLNRDLSIN